MIPQTKDEVADRRSTGPIGFMPAYRRRNVVERGINRAKQHRGCTTCRDRLAVHFEVPVQVTVIRYGLKQLL
ncbi:hypothetical protein [Corynebacterium glutamicum]|uniref:hypothetical protein n=1 Tax=Corynebacterium glutamicum TaxID=1718 RepID=UPI00358DD7BD